MRLGFKMAAAQFRCNVCESITGPRPRDCEQIVRFTCVGPKISANEALAQAQARITELEKTIKTMQKEHTMKKRALSPPSSEYRCQCCGQRVIGGACGC